MSKDTEAPDLAKANKEAVEAYIANLPKEYAIKQTWQPRMNEIEFQSQERALNAFIDALVGSEGASPSDVFSRFGLDSEYQQYLAGRGERPVAPVRADYRRGGLLGLIGGDDEKAYQDAVARYERDLAQWEKQGLSRDEWVQQYIAQNPDSEAAQFYRENRQPGLLERQYQADLQYMPKFLELDLQHARDSALGMADAQWEVQEKYGDRYLETAMDQARKADPDWFATREQAADLVMEELAKGSQLTDAQRREAEQSIRAGQAARGNILGPAATVDEALQKFSVGEQMKQQRLTNAMAFLGGQQPGSQFAGVQQAQQGAAPFNPMARQGSVFNNINPQGGFNPAASVWDRGMINSNAQNIYNTQYDANKTNAAAGNQMMGQMMGMAGGLMMCWVAREVYGADDPRWLEVKDWMLERAPEELRLAYARHGEQYADYIRDKPELKARWRRFFDEVLEEEAQLERLGIGGNN